ncbi:MAG TPA: DNA ligase D, partial [Patescibacteria group bacterium]
EFILNGSKLRGEFALVKIKPKISYFSRNKKAGNNWLLLKMKKDEPIATIKKDKMPHEIQPMLATLTDQPFDKENWFFEIKWDGYRAITEIENGEVKLYSRNGLSFISKFPDLVKELKKIKHDAVLDGEVVVLSKNGKPSFQMLQDYDKKHEGELVYYVFDILYLDGEDLQSKPLRERKNILKTVINENGTIALGDEVEKVGKAFFEAVKEQDLEGIMAKDASSPYRQGVRGQEWLKLKTHLRQEAIICGFTAPKGSREKFGALVLGAFKNNNLDYIGDVGTGFDDRKLIEIYKMMKPLVQKKCPFADVPKIDTGITWIKPKLIAEIKFQEWTGEGLMRQPVFLGLREDKSPQEVVEEGKYFGSTPPLKENEKSRVVVIGKQPVSLIHMDKVFWPDEGYTKGDLISYYREISPFILPHLKDRPESLLRYPEGITGEGFFHKDVEIAPGWVETFKYKSEGKTINYLLCNNEASLVYLINLGCIDLNPWNSRINKVDNPDYMILDLDPEEADFKLVVKTALSIHELYEELGIDGFIKTSGARGIHIYTPLEAKYTYDQARQLAQIIAIKVNEKLPKITSLERSPANRKGKVYLDCFQNARGQTLASVYSVRAKPGATVSTPLQWDEVNEKLSPKLFTMTNTFKRLEKYGDLFEPVLGKGIDMNVVLKKLN